MNKLDLTKIVKYVPVIKDKIENSILMVIDYEDIKDDDSSKFPQIGIKVFEKKLKDEQIKTCLESNLNDIYEEVLNTYYELDLENDKIEYPIFEHNLNEDDKRLLLKCNSCGSKIAMESRRGPANVIIVPDKEIEKRLNKWGTNQTIFINPTNVHKDKIFIIRVDPDGNSPGLTLFTSVNLNGSRHTKLLKLLRKMGREIKDLDFEYCISKVGFKPNTFVRCIYLKEN